MFRFFVLILTIESDANCTVNEKQKKQQYVLSVVYGTTENAKFSSQNATFYIRIDPRTMTWGLFGPDLDPKIHLIEKKNKCKSPVIA